MLKLFQAIFFESIKIIIFRNFDEMIKVDKKAFQ